ncbi:MAG: inositol monophosphatase family protein [Candidatus Hodarchaeales archaeon]|jgi:myo-inositol-1(or 4)-monophosphatase
MDETEAEYLRVAEQAVRMAGSFLRLMSLEDLRVFKKDGGEIVTNFDLESERLITNAIRMHFPDHKIVAEEAGDTTTHGPHRIVWYVDPLDGTKAFLRGNFAYVCVAVGVRDHEGLVAGCLLNPFVDMLYTASRSGRARLNGVPLFPVDDRPLNKARMLIDFSSRLPQHIQRTLSMADVQGVVGRTFRLDGSISQHLALIAQGTLDGGIFWGVGRKGNYWDIAGAIQILEKLNVIITNLEGEPITPTSEIFDQLVVGPPVLHAEVLDWAASIKGKSKLIRRSS